MQRASLLEIPYFDLVPIVEYSVLCIGINTHNFLESHNSQNIGNAHRQKREMPEIRAKTQIRNACCDGVVGWSWSQSSHIVAFVL